MKTTWKHLLKLMSKSPPLRKLEHPEVEMLGEQVATQRLLETRQIVHSTNIYGVLGKYRAEEQEQRLPKKKGGVEETDTETDSSNKMWQIQREGLCGVPEKPFWSRRCQLGQENGCFRQEQLHEPMQRGLGTAWLGGGESSIPAVLGYKWEAVVGKRWSQGGGKSQIIGSNGQRQNAVKQEGDLVIFVFSVELISRCVRVESEIRLEPLENQLVQPLGKGHNIAIRMSMSSDHRIPPPELSPNKIQFKLGKNHIHT